MAGYIHAIWRCRYFWLSLVRMDLRSRYRGSVLGMGWSLLNPIAMTGIICVAFHQIFHEPLSDFAPFLLVGLACWNYVQHATLTGCQCFFQGEAYIRQYPAPLAIYPLRTVLGGGFHFLIAMGLAIVVAAWTKGVPNPLAILSLLPTILLLVVLCWALAVLAGLANVYFQDSQHLCQVGFQVLFYLTPIMYPPRMLESNDLGKLLAYNPLTSFLTLLREPLLHGSVPSATTFVVAAVTATVIGGTAVATLISLERRFIFHL